MVCMNASMKEEIVYVANNDEITHFADFNEARCHYISASARHTFSDLLQCAILSKIKLGSRPRRILFRGNMNRFVYENYVLVQLEENHIGIKKTGNVFKWDLTYEQARKVFQYNNDLNKQENGKIYYIDQLKFLFNESFYP